MKFIITTLLFALICTAQAADTYTATLTEFLKVSGVSVSHEKVINDLATKFGISTSDSKFTKALAEQIKRLNQDLTPIYQEYLTQDDLKSMIKFFNSPIGKHFVESQPEILDKSAQVISEWQSGLKDALLKSSGDSLKKSLPSFSF